MLKQFHILIDQLQSFDLITVIYILTDIAFKHQITLSNKTILPITVSTFYVFNLSTDSQYNDSEFKGLFINLRASTQSTRSIN